MSARRHAAAFTFTTEKLANNNQFNYPQNIYCRIGFVIQTQRRRVETRSDFLLHCVRPFFQTVCRRYCPIYCVLFYTAKLSVRVQQLYGFLHLYVSHRSALSLSHLLFCVSCLELWDCWSHWPVRKTDITRAFIWAFLCGFAFCLVFVFSSYGYVLQQVLQPPTLLIKDHNPGYDISEMMSIFTRTSPPPPSGENKIFTNATSSPVTHHAEVRNVTNHPHVIVFLIHIHHSE